MPEEIIRPGTITKTIKISKKDICYVSHIFEAYEGLAILRTLDAGNGVLAVWISTCFFEDVMTIINELKKEINIIVCENA